jgi:membrane protein insertase Oxa1/YidC/SpoIIIJ
MSSEGSEQMLSLLKELAVFKAMDQDYRAGPKGQAETEAYGERERRRQEIKQEMQELAAESKGNPS